MNTIEQFSDLSTQLATKHERAINSEEAYRVARATKYLELAVPADGSKKPSDEVIKARLEVDAELNRLRHTMEKDAAELSVSQYYYRALIATQAAKEC